MGMFAYDARMNAKLVQDKLGTFLMIGCGNMGGALLSGWLNAGALQAFSQVVVQKPSVPIQEKALNGVRYVTALSDVREVPTIIVVATKPHQMDEVLAQCQTQFGNAPIYVSIAAGKTIASMQRTLGHGAKIIRTMPNTPTQIGAGVTGMCATQNVPTEMRQKLTEIFLVVGLALWIEESEMDALTALSGSGPAYTFYFMECLVDAAVEIGLSRADADLLARHTVYGASALAVLKPEPISQLREKVTSKGGTTEAALKIWMQSGTLDAQAKVALEAAKKRACEMSDS